MCNEQLMRTWEEPGRTMNHLSLESHHLGIFSQHIKVFPYTLDDKSRITFLQIVKTEEINVENINLYNISSLYNLQIHDQSQFLHTCTQYIWIVIRLLFTFNLQDLFLTLWRT